jgi:hypothetical protein
VTATTTGDTMRIELPFPPTAVPTLQLRIGPCHLRFTPSEGPAWISGTYSDPTQMLPVDVRSEGAVATIAQRIDLRTLGEIQLPRLDLAISRERPLALDIQAGASDSTFDLGGLPLARLVMKAGAGRFDVDFSTPNPTAMAHMGLELGAGAFFARHLANANFAELRVGGGISACTLDFAGELRGDANARVDAGFASLDVFVPAATSARVLVKSFATGSQVGSGFTRKGDAYYTEPAVTGMHPLLTIDISMAFGTLGLRTS